MNLIGETSTNGIENEGDATGTEEAPDLLRVGQDLVINDDRESALDETPEEDENDDAQTGAPATANAPVILDLTEDEESEAIMASLSLNENDLDPENQAKIREACGKMYGRNHRSYTKRTQLSLLRGPKGLARGYSDRYALRWLPREVVGGKLMVDVLVSIDRADEISPESMIQSFGRLLDSRTREYVEGYIRNEETGERAQIVDENGHPLHMKCFYLTHLRQDKRAQPSYQGRGHRAGPRGEVPLALRNLLESKWRPGERLLGQTYPFSRRTNNGDRYFYLSLMNEELREKARAMHDTGNDQLMAYHAAFGITPRVMPNIDEKSGKVVIHHDPDLSHHRRRENPLGFIAVMAPCSMTAIQWNVDEQQEMVRRDFAEVLCEIHEPKEPAKKNKYRGRSI